ncbi:MAG: hypothetical protein J6D02_12350 [Lachnospira sp.]|nr:hypothetical protein [Lachnospira sp.]
MHKVIKIIFITFLSIIGIAFLISAYYLATYELPTPVDKWAIVKEKALNYLNERYGEDFEIVNFIEPEPYHNFYNITALRIGDPNDIEHEVTLHGWVTKGEKKLFKKGKDKITFYDNYAAVKIIPELKNHVANILKTECHDCKIYISFYREWIKQNTKIYSSVVDFIQRDDFWKKCMDIQIITFNTNIENKSKLEKISYKCAKKIFENNFTDTATIYYISNPNIYAGLSDSLEIYDWTTDPSHKTSKYGNWGKDYVYVDCYIKDNKLLTELIELEDGFYGSN